MQFKDWFPADYKVEINPELPASGPLPNLYSMESTGDTIGTGNYVRIIRRDGQTWHLFLKDGDGGQSKVCSTPINHMCLICSKGNCVLASSAVPGELSPVKIYPVQGILPLVDHSLLLLWSFDSLVCMDRMGVAWQHNRLVSDELSVELGQDGLLLVSGWGGHPVTRKIKPISGEML